MPSRTLISTLSAELVGTFLFIAVGGAAVISDAQTGGAVGLVGMSLTFGLVIAALATAFGPISGAHFNPAVTVAFWLVGKIRTVEGIRYIVVQVLGAIPVPADAKFGIGEHPFGAFQRIRSRAGVDEIPHGVAQVGHGLGVEGFEAVQRRLCCHLFCHDFL